MKQLFVLLFPQDEYLEFEFNADDIALFNECILKRYIEKGFEFCIVNYKNSQSKYISQSAQHTLFADVTFEQSSAKHSKDWRYADFELLSKSFHFGEYDKVVISGFHCFDCVEKFANEIFKINPSVLIDTDLTEMFRGTSRYVNGWDIQNFDANKKLERIYEKEFFKDTLQRMKDRYSNPVWGIGKELLTEIDNQIKNFDVGKEI